MTAYINGVGIEGLPFLLLVLHTIMFLTYLAIVRIVQQLPKLLTRSPSAFPSARVVLSKRIKASVQRATHRSRA